MRDDSEFLAKRLKELAERAERTGLFTFSPFLGMAEQDVFYRTVKPTVHAKATAFGGVGGCERVMLRFGDSEELGYEEPFPIVCLLLEPTAPKFAESLTHRDYLGALMHLGMEREMLGDIVVRDKVAYLFAHERMANVIIEDLTRVRHTELRVKVAPALPEGALYRTEERLLQASGERLDGVIAKLYHISRSDALALFHRELVFVDGRACTSPAREVAEGACVSVRGYGRFIYRGFRSETKKGKLNLVVDVYV